MDPQAPSIAAARMAATCGVGLNNVMATGVNMLGDVHGGPGNNARNYILIFVIGSRPDLAWSQQPKRVLKVGEKNMGKSYPLWS